MIYRIIYKFYPFNVINLKPDYMNVEADSLEEAFGIMEKRYGDRIEIFKEPARKYYNEM